MPGAGSGRVTAVFAAAGAARAVYRALVRIPPGEPALWEKKNRSGRVVDLYAGPGAAVGTLLAVLSAPALSARTKAAAAAAVTAAAAAGVYHDLVGSGDRRGLKDRLGALRRGEVTSEAAELAGIGVAGLAAGALLKARPVDRLLAGVVVAGFAHAMSLLDAAPGRAGKAVLAAGAPGVLRGGQAGVLAAAPVGAAAALIGDDLAERTTLGDCGTHALGAALGVSAAAASGRAGLVLHAVALAALAAAGDRVGDSTAVWGSAPGRWADGLGRPSTARHARRR